MKHFFLFRMIFRLRTKSGESHPRTQFALTFMLNANASISIFIAIFYWCLVFPNLSAENQNRGFADKVLGHGAIPVLVLVDLLVFSSRRPAWLHFWQPLCAGLAYLTFSGIYYQLGGRGYVR